MTGPGRLVAAMGTSICHLVLGPEARIVESYKPTMIGSVGIGVRKGDTELLAKINASLTKLKANGTVEKILDKWGLKAQGT